MKNKVMLAALLAFSISPALSYPRPSEVIEQNQAKQQQVLERDYQRCLDDFKNNITYELSRCTGRADVDIYFDIRGHDLKQIMDDLAVDGWRSELVHCEAPDYNFLEITVL